MGVRAQFICFVVAMFVGIAATALVYAGRRIALLISVGLTGWFAYAYIIWKLGILARVNALPPGILFILGPVAAYLLAAALSLSFARPRWVLAIPGWLLIGAQSFRVVVELFIHKLWVDGVVPKTLTFSGENVDIFIGASALLVAPVVSLGVWGRRAGIAWNCLGLLALGNVVARAVLTAPGPLNFIHAQPPNRMFVTFPFLFIPACFVPLAVSLHVASLVTLMRDPHRSSS